jgi:sodium/bile acid cotransporter 7
LALMLTVGTNLLGIVTVPFMMGLVLNGADVSLDALDLLFKLGLTIFIPLAVGKVLRDSVAAVPLFMTANKVLMGFVNNGSLAFVVFQEASRSADSITSLPADRYFEEY